jgi:signal transduction histidine kinase
MDSLFWQVISPTAETLLILNLFHLLLAGLSLLVLLHQLRSRDLDRERRPEPLLVAGFSCLALHFALLTTYFGTTFFLRRDLQLEDPERMLHGIFIVAVLLMGAAYHQRAFGERPRWLWPAIALAVVVVAVDVVVDRQPLAGHSHSAFMLMSDAIGFFAVMRAAWLVAHREWEARAVRLLALLALALVLLAHGLPQFLPYRAGVAAWNLDEHVLSLALVAFAWAAGERSRDLLDRVFVRLNLTFIVLASLIMLATAGMEKYQYFRITEERSVGLAEFLRGHVVYYGEQREGLAQVFAHPEVMKRVVVEFGNMPELRVVDVSYRGEHASFWILPSGEIRQLVGMSAERHEPEQGSFSMIRLPIQGAGAVEFTGTTAFLNQRISNYIIFIYSSFTLVLLLATGVIGMIVADTDRQLKRRYAELQEAQQQLAQAAKLASIGELAGGMAHEINNPITGILSLASHMSTGKAAERFTARDRKNLQLIADQAERITNLVKGLMTFSRQTKLALAPVRVHHLIDTALDLVAYRMSRGHIEVVREIEFGLPPMLGDESRLAEVLINLLGNAIDAMPEGGRLTVRAYRDPESPHFVRLEVQDAGIGIASSDLSRIFDPFFTTKAPGHGTGLGLSISHGIVKDHGGQIWAHSEPNAGTTIVLSLPEEVSVYEAAHSGD